MCVVSGLPILLGGPKPGSVTAALPVGLVFLWAGTLALGGVLVVLAALVPKLTTALYLELTADLPLALTTVTYGIAVPLVAGYSGVPTSAVFTGASVAFAIRWAQVYRTVRTLRAALARPGG